MSHSLGLMTQLRRYHAGIRLKSSEQTFSGIHEEATAVDATDSNWQQRRRCFGGYDVGATEAG